MPDRRANLVREKDGPQHIGQEGKPEFSGPQLSQTNSVAPRLPVVRGEQPSFEQELAQDVLEIITVFSARLYGSRSHKTQKLLDVVRENSAELSKL